jgi:LysM repeat protein
MENNFENNSIYYTVEKGETLFSISRKFNVSITKLKELNNNMLQLKVGEKIKIR